MGDHEAHRASERLRSSFEGLGREGMASGSRLRAVTRLCTNPWFELVRRDRVVLLTRSDRTFDTAEELSQAHEEVIGVLDGLPRETLGILVDLRLAPSRNDPEFERAMLEYRPRLFGRFARRAVLVRSAVGKLHVQRHANQDGHRDLEVFTDLDEALTFVAGE